MEQDSHTSARSADPQYRTLERALRESERRYRALFNCMAEGFAIHEAILDGAGRPCDYRFLDVNPAFERITGLRRDEVIGRTLRQVLTGNDPHWIEVYERVALTGEPAHLEAYSTSLGRHFEVFAYRIGERQFACVFFDVTERYRAAEALRRRAEEVERLLEVVPAAVWVARDPQCLTITGNRRANEFYDAAAGENVSASSLPLARRFFSPDGRELSAEELPMQVAAATNQDVRDVELHVQMPSGRRIVMLGNAVPLRDEAGQVRGCIGAFLDITDRKRAEAEIRSMARFPEENPNPVLRAARDGSVLYANQPAQQLLAALGWQAGQALPRPLIGVIDRVLDGGGHGELELEDSRGRVWSFLLSPSAQHDHTNLYGREITERRRATEALHRTTERYALLSQTAGALLAAPDPQALVESLCRRVMAHLRCDVFLNCLMDEAGGRLRVNACAGIPAEEALKIGSLDAGAAACSCVAGGRRPIVVEHLQDAPDERARLVRSHGMQAYCCHPLLTGDRLIGTLSFGTKRRSRFTADEVDLMRAVADQVAVAMERVRHEQALRDSELFHRQLLESIPGMVFTSRPDGYCDFQSQQWVEFTGVPAGEHLGDGWNRLLHPDDRPRALAEWRAAVEGRGTYDLEYRVRRYDGRYEWFKVIGRPIRDAEGQIVRWFGVAANIDALKRAEQQLQQVNETLEQRVAERTAEAQQRAEQLRALAAQLAHAEQRERKRIAMVLHDHFQQLLVGAKLDLTIVRSRVNGPDVGPDLERISHTLDEAIEASRSLAVELSPPVLHDMGLAAGLGWLARWMHQRHGLRVRVCADAGVDAPDEEIRNVLYSAVRELLYNVVKHAGAAAATVELARPDDRHIRVRVCDDGAGFDPERMHPRDRLAGFGLFSIRERIEMLGGTLEVDSLPGRGTRIALQVPIGS